MKKRKWSLIYLLVNILVIMGIAFFDPNIGNIGQVFYRLDFKWIVVAILSMVLFWFFDGLVVYYAAASILRIKLFVQSMRISILGKYYNAVTPFASGGQPSQLYFLVREGVPTGQAGSILIIKFCVYQLIISLFSLVAFAFKGRFINEYSSLLFWAAVVGFAINAGGFLLTLALAVRENVLKKIADWILIALHKIKLVKEPNRIRDNIFRHVKDFHDSFIIIRDNPKTMAVLGIFMAVEISFLVSIPYFIYRACGLNTSDWFEIAMVFLFLYLAVSFFPTPGATGASEGGYYLLFNLFFPQQFLFLSMLLWRVVTYYLTIVVGAVIVLIDSMRGFQQSV